MASIIRIKRSTSLGEPDLLRNGELAYSALADNGSNGGDRLYIAVGEEDVNGNAPHYVIGGKYFTDMLDHTKGTLTASSAIIVDANKKIDELLAGNLGLTLNTIRSTDTNGDINITPNGTGNIVLDSQKWPQVDGSANSFLKTDGAGQLSWAAIPPGSFTIAGDDSTSDVFTTGETLTFSGSDPIDTTISNNTVTISAKNATTSSKGVASFSSSGFSVTSGAVSLVTSVVQSITTESGALTPSSNSFTITGGEGIDVTHTGTTITVAGELASTSNPGVASFASGDFAVSAGGEVTIKTGGVDNNQLANSSLTVGTTTISLGGTSTSLAGLTELTVDNLNFNGNEISSTDTNGDISLNPNGTGSIAVNGAKITGLAEPTASNHAATKNYVDNAVTGLTWKSAANLLVDFNIPLTGATETLYIDGHDSLGQAEDGYRLLLINQSTPTENGIYVYNDDGSSVNYTLSRATDADVYSELIGTSVFILEGTTYANTGWVQSNHYLTDFSGQQWVQFSGAGAYAAGAGLTQTGTTFNVGQGDGITVTSDAVSLASSVAGAGLTYSSGVINVVGTTNRIDVSANAIDISTTYAGQTSIVTLGTVATGTWNADTISVSKGGTGRTSVTARAVVYGNGTSAMGETGVSAIDGSFLREDSTGNPYWSNVIDGGTY